MSAGQGEGFITVRVGRLPGQIQEYALNGQRNVAAALQAANMSSTGYEVRVNNVPVTDFTQAVSQGDTVLLVKQIKGNSSPDRPRQQV